jgi:hypothetical protein
MSTDGCVVWLKEQPKMPVTLEERPAKMRGLKTDERGYPIPWFVGYVDGKPEFRSMDAEKWVRAIRQGLCWVCGNLLGTAKTFVAGPMCGINRTSAEPPCHIECARYSARNCPFLSQPNMIRREDEFTRECEAARPPAGIALSRNPGVTLLWQTRHFDVFDDFKGGKLICMGEPFNCEWYREGRIATRAEVEESIASGLPALEVMARLEPGAMEALAEARERFKRYLPV